MWPHPDYDEHGKAVYKNNPDGTIEMKGYTPSWFHRYIANRFEDLESRKLPRVTLSMPPRSGKTLLLNKFIAWYIGRNPTHSVIHASANQRNATKFGREIRNAIEGKAFQCVFPGITLATDSNSTSEFEICTSESEQGKTERGGYFACGTGTNTQGRKGNLIVLDDIVGKGDQAASKDQRDKLWDWYLSDAYSRLEPGGVIVINQTRWWEDDIIGRALKEQKHEEWFEIRLPAHNRSGKWLWPERFSSKAYENIKLTQSSRNWNALYMQSPVQESGEIFKRNHFRMYPADQKLPDLDFIIQSYDTAYGEDENSDYNAATTWGVFNTAKYCREVDDGRPTLPYGILLLDAWKEIQPFHELREVVAEEFEASFGGNGRKTDLVVVEGKATGLSIVQELRYANIPVKVLIPKGDKKTRAMSVEHYFENGFIWLPESKRKKGEFRDWCEPLIKELVSFDKGEYDDFVDSAVQAIRYLSDSGWIRTEPLVEDEEEYIDHKRQGKGNPYG